MIDCDPELSDITYQTLTFSHFFFFWLSDEKTISHLTVKEKKKNSPLKCFNVNMLKIYVPFERILFITFMFSVTMDTCCEIKKESF